MTDLEEWQKSYKDSLTRLAGQIAGWVGEDQVRSIYLCGSFANNEGTVLIGEKEKPIILSDIDMAVVTDDVDTLKRIYGKRRILSERAQRSMPGIYFEGNIDIGVMTPGDLNSLPPSPGVYEMRNNGVVLYGDPQVLSIIPDYSRGDISGYQGLVLLENRMASLLGTLVEPARSELSGYMKGWYQISRVYTDLALAAICITGDYVSGYRARMNYLKEERNNELMRRFISSDLLDKMKIWTEFKLKPDMTSGVNNEEEAVIKSGVVAAGDIFNLWRNTGSYLAKDISDPNPTTPADKLLESYRERKFHPDHLRAWKEFLMGESPINGIITALELWRYLFIMRPLDVVRENAVRLIEHLLCRGENVPVEKPAAGFPHSGGAWKSAAASTYGQWSRLVFG